MSPRRGETVYLVRSAVRDQNGDWIEPDVPRLALHGAAVAPRSSTESDDRTGSGVVVGLTVHLPPQASVELVTSESSMEVRGELYDVDGEPGTWLNPYTQRLRGVQVALTRAQGS